MDDALPFDTALTLQTLENSDWGEPDNGATSLMISCLLLRRKPLKDFSLADIRVLLEQKISPEFLVPLALSKIDKNPLVEGELYPGDVLCSLVSQKKEFWDANQDLEHTVFQLTLDVQSIKYCLDEYVIPKMAKFVQLIS